jgi:hypothetical protein
MNALQVNPVTGFLESKNPNEITFDSNRKKRYLEMAREAAERGEWPDQHAMAKMLGITIRTVHWHFVKDEVFKAQWEECIDIIENELLKTMVAQGKRPSGYMDRITWLRAHRPERWNPDYNKPQLTVDIAAVKRVLSDDNTVIDAVIVDK